jgi:hypothetical protein
MPPTTASVRAVPLGQTFTAETPLGDAGDALVASYLPATGKGKLHGAEDCGRLRSTSASVRVELPLREAAGRLCGNCRWSEPTDSPVLRRGAAVIDVDNLKAWLGQGPGPEHKAAQADAALALATGEYPPAQGTGTRVEESSEQADSETENWNEEE